jgi:hypothetical protein
MEEVIVSRLEIGILIAALILAFVGVVVFQQGQMATIKTHFAKSFSDCISPNELSTKHKIGPTAESCIKCHSYTGGIPDAKCEQCHADIKERRTMQVGFHGTLKGACISCHKEHPSGNKTNVVIPVFREKFNHDLTSFKLEGKHVKVECDDCHKKKRTPEMKGIYYVGLKYGLCTDCHRDQHNGQFVAACDKCHSANGWTGKELKFAHATDSSFKLTDKHETLACIKCHKSQVAGAVLGSAVFKGLPTECAGCHEDPHRKQFASSSCTTCHSSKGWKKEFLAFEHNKDSKFKLEAKHANLACEKCHLPFTNAPSLLSVSPASLPIVPLSPTISALASAQFRGLKSECVDCHKDPHQNQFVAACTKCHSPAGWRKEFLAFDHNKDTKYQLVAKHAQVSCEKCHLPLSTTPPALTAGQTSSLAYAKFRDLKTDCADCHKEPHRGQFKSACTKCHTAPTAWSVKQIQFDHNKDTKFQLAGKHARVDCIKCHKPLTKGGPLGSANFIGLGKTCEDCHKVKHAPEYGSSCMACHNTLDRWPKKKPAVDHMQKYDVQGEVLTGKHLQAECRLCHNGLKVVAIGQSTKSPYQCITCHAADDAHKGTLGNLCSKCHGMTGWKGEHLRFDHNTMTSYALDKDHKNVACAKCHTENRWKPLNSTCKSCHPNKY